MEDIELKVPTFKELFEAYKKACEARRQSVAKYLSEIMPSSKNIKVSPSVRTTQTVLYSVDRLLRILEWSLDRPYTDLNVQVCKLLAEYLRDVEGFAPTSIKTMLGSVARIRPSWAIPFYRRLGYNVKRINLRGLMYGQYK